MFLKAAVKGLDSLLRRCYGIHPFTDHPECVLRLGLARSPRDITLSDSVTVCRGEPIGDLHLWNERIPPMPTGGPGLGWAVAFQRRLRRSLEELAVYVETGPPYREVRAFRAIGSTAARPGAAAHGVVSGLIALAGRFGFEAVEPARSPGPWRRFTEFWENLYAVALVWTYNPPSLKTKGLPRLHRVELWVSRDGLLDRCGRLDSSRHAAQAQQGVAVRRRGADGRHPGRDGGPGRPPGRSGCRGSRAFWHSPGHRPGGMERCCGKNRGPLQGPEVRRSFEAGDTGEG